MITFNRFEYSKELFEKYKGSLDLDEDAIVLIDSGTDKYIYAKGSYFGSTEIYKGNIEPTDKSIKLWLDTNEPASLKYKNSKEEWETISTGGTGTGTSVEVINRLDSDSTTGALSAKQGKVLKDLIDNLPIGDSAGVKRYQVFSIPTEEQLPLNKAAYNAVMNDEDAIFYIESDGEIVYSNTHLKYENAAIIGFKVISPNSKDFIIEEYIYTQIVIGIDSDGNAFESPISNLSGTIPSTEKVQSLIDTAIEGITPGSEGSSSPEVYIGNEQPSEDSDVVVWYDTSGGTDEPETSSSVTWDDVEDKPEFAEVAFSGSYNDLKDTPDTIKKTYYVHGQIDRQTYHLTNEQLLDNIYAKRSINNKEDANYIIHVVDNDKYYKDSTVVTNAEASVVLVAVCFDDEDSTIGNKTVNPSVTSVQILITNGDIIGGEPMGGSGNVHLDSAYLSTKNYVDLHTTTYIGSDTPSSKYNLWVDTSKEEVVFKYKKDNQWNVLSTGGSGNIVVDTALDGTSSNPIANNAVYNLGIRIEETFEDVFEALSEKANTENALVEGRGFKVTDNVKYYLPNTTTSTDPTVDDSHIIATKADTLSNETLNKKATLYNLYAMDDLTSEQLASNEVVFQAAQNGEVALYRVYTNDTAYALADVKIVDGPYLEAYVYVTTPNTTDKQVTITRYKYSFNQAGEYLPSDEDVEEIVVPSLSKVEDMVGSSGGNNGLEIRILSDDTPEENIRTIELVEEGKALAGLADEFGVSILNYLGDRKFSQTIYVEDWQVHMAITIELGENGALISQGGYALTGDLTIVDVADFKIWYRWQTSLFQATNNRNIRTFYIVEENQRCLVDSISFNSTTTELQYNYNDKRYKRVYTNETGEYTKEEIVVNSGGGTGGGSGGLETRILYIPNFTAGGTLTPEEKAYNLETCQKLLAGTARAALSLEGDVPGSYALNTYCEDVLDLSVLGEEGYYIPFKWTYAVQLGATIVGPDGDILLFGGGQSTTVSDLILNEDLSNLGDIGSAVMEQYIGGKLPTVYYVVNDMGSLLQLVPLHPFGTFSNAAIILQGIGESFDGNEQTKYNLTCYNAATNQPAEFEATPIATKIYIGKPSTEHKNINKAFANKPFGLLGIGPMPVLVYEDSSSAEILRWKSYQPLEKYIVPNLETGDWGDYTHIEFLIFREGKYERWKLDMEGITSLIE